MWTSDQLAESWRIRATQVEVSDQFAMDVLVTAVEGGSNDWADFGESDVIGKEYKFRSGRRIFRLSCLDIYAVKLREYESEGVFPNRWVTISYKDIQAAVQRVLSPEFKVADQIRAAILNDDVDAEAADVILQAAVFKEIVYG